MSWYNLDWEKRKPITIDSTVSEETDQNIRADVVFVVGKMQADFADVVFTDEDG